MTKRMRRENKKEGRERMNDAEINMIEREKKKKNQWEWGATVPGYSTPKSLCHCNKLLFIN